MGAVCGGGRDETLMRGLTEFPLGDRGWGQRGSAGARAWTADRCGVWGGVCELLAPRRHPEKREVPGKGDCRQREGGDWEGQDG